MVYNYIHAGYFPMRYMVHQLFLLTPGDEVVYCLLIRKSAFINKLWLVLRLDLWTCNCRVNHIGLIIETYNINVYIVN